MLLFGIAMVMIMVWRPRGLLSFREPTIRLHPKEHTEKTQEAA
jgi:branched-chain amino acid transport system permease protein